MDAQLVWKRGMSFNGTADTGFTVPVGTTPDFGGDNDGFKPLELLLIGLAGCTSMDVVSILKKKRQNITNFEVKIHAERAEEHPKVFTSIVMEYIVKGNSIDPAAVERAVELSTTKYCSAHAMLSKAVPISHTITIL
jgi:putative redox protein